MKKPKTKGDILRAVAKKNGLKIKDLPLKVMKLKDVLGTPIDLRGMPVFEPKPGTKTTILDEVNAAPRKIQKKAYKACLKPIAKKSWAAMLEDSLNDKSLAGKKLTKKQVLALKERIGKVLEDSKKVTPEMLEELKKFAAVGESLPTAKQVMDGIGNKPEDRTISGVPEVLRTRPQATVFDSSKFTHWIYADLSGEVCCYTGSKKDFDEEVPKDSRTATLFKVVGENVERLGYYA